MSFERDYPYYFFRANQQQAGTKIYSLTQCSLSMNECDWHILAGNDECLIHIVWLVAGPLIPLFWTSGDISSGVGYRINRGTSRIVLNIKILALC